MPSDPMRGTFNSVAVCRVNMYTRLGFVLFFLLPGISKGQILRDKDSFETVKKGVECIYNMQFEEAREAFGHIGDLHPGHPAFYLLRGMTTYWENFPLTSSSPAQTSFENDLRTCISNCEKFASEDEAEYLLTNLCARGLLLLFYSDNNMSGKVMPLAAGTYGYLRKAFGFTGAYADFYFFTGLYNYYREAYPEAHPIYKSFAFVFPKGDKPRGLQELQAASKNSIVLKAESSLFLAYIWQFYENDYPKSLSVSRSLNRLYPDNDQFRASLVKSLLLDKRYDEADSLIILGFQESANSYVKAELVVMKGIVQEKKYRNYALAGKFYMEGVDAMASFGDFGNEFAAYSYFGLSRICAYTNRESERRQYRKKAHELTDFRTVSFD